VVGEGSLVVGTAGDWAVNGAWVLECDGSASWSETESLAFDHAPTVGEVATIQAPPAFLKCYVQSCAFPEGFCPRAEGAYPALKDCADGRAMTDADLEPPAPLEEPTRPEPRVVQTLATSSGDRVDVTPPPGPIPPCDTPAELVDESIRYVDTGNDQELSGEPAAAAMSYRTALSRDACNTAAWVALGNLAGRQGQHAAAARAFDTALLLNPEHYGAAVGLGTSREALGDREGAAEAYQQALDARPGLPEAVDGLQRLGVSAR